MKCIKCGAENAEGSSFCIQCGNKLESNLNANSEISTNETTINNVEPLNTNDSTNEVPTNNVEPSITNDSTNEVPTNNVDSSSVGNSNTTISNVANTIPNNNVTTTEMNNLNNNIKENNGKKKSRVGLVIVLILCLLIIAATTTLLIIWNSGNGKDKTNNINTNSINSVNGNNSKTNTNNNNNNSNTNKDYVINFDNYNIDIEMIMEISGISTKANFSGTIDEKNQIEYLKMTMNVLGYDLTSETYTDLKNGITYISDSFTGEWTKEKYASEILDLKGLLQSLKNMSNVEKIDDNHFKVKITNNEVKGMLDLNEIDLESITGDIYAEITTNNDYIEEIKYDFSNLTEEFEKLILNMKISNYNKAGDIQIPEDVIKNATEF